MTKPKKKKKKPKFIHLLYVRKGGAILLLFGICFSNLNRNIENLTGKFAEGKSFLKEHKFS